MHQLARFSLANPRITIAIVTIVTVLLGAGLFNLRTEFGFRVIIGDEHPSIRNLDAFIEGFSGGLPVQIAWECGDGFPCDHALDDTSLQMADAVGGALAAAIGVRSVQAPSNAPLLLPAADGISIRRFIEHGLLAPDRDALRVRALEDPLWVDRIVSADGTAGSIFVQQIDTLASTDKAVVAAIEAALAPFEAAGFEFYLVGASTGSVLVGRSLANSMMRVVPLLVAVLAIVLFALSRSLQHTIIAISTMGLALLWTFGLMGWLGWPRDAIHEILAPLVLVVGVCDAMHLLARFADQRASNPDSGPSSVMLEVARDIAGPCIVTTATTAAAYLSFTTSALDAFIRFGMISAFGVVSCLLLTFSLLPVLATRFGSDGAAHRKASQAWGHAMTAVVNTGERRWRAILGVSLVLLLVFGAGWILRLRVDMDWYESFGEASEPMRGTRFVETHMGHTETLEVRLDLPQDKRLHEESTLREVAAIAASLSDVEGLGAATSVLDLIDRARWALRDSDPSAKVRSGEILELLSLDASLLPSWVSLDGTMVRISLVADELSHKRVRRLMSEVHQVTDPLVADGWGVLLSGETAINYDWVEDVQRTQLSSFPMAFGIVFVIVALLFRSIPLAVAALIPTLIPIVVTLGAMAWIGLSLDVGRAMIAAILIGIGVDDAVHILTQFQRRQRAGESPAEAIVGALQHSGRPVVTTSIALSLGFLALMASAWQTIASFGFFAAIAILGALGSTLFVLPALVFAFTKDRGEA